MKYTEQFVGGVQGHSDFSKPTATFLYQFRGKLNAIFETIMVMSSEYIDRIDPTGFKHYRNTQEIIASNLEQKLRMTLQATNTEFQIQMFEQATSTQKSTVRIQILSYYCLSRKRKI